VKWPNKPDAPNPAIAPPFHVGHHCRRVGDPKRSAGDFTGLDKTWGLATVEHMSRSVEAIAADAVRLPPDQRLTLAHRILSSVEPIGSGEVEAAWDVEIRRRITAHDAGNVAAVSSAEVFAELDRRLRP